MCLLLFVCATCHVSAQNLSLKELRELIHPDTRDVTLSDSVRHKVMADRILVTATVKASGRDRPAAFAANRASRDALKSAMIRVGLNHSDVTYQPFSFDTRSGVFKKVRSHELSSRVTIRVTNEAEFLEVLKVLSSRGEEWSFQKYDVEDSKEMENRRAALEKVLAKLESRKSFFEQRLNLQLTPVQFVDNTESTGGPVARRAMTMSKLSSSFGAAGGVVQSDAAFGQITYVVNLSVTYAAKPKE